MKFYLVLLTVILTSPLAWATSQPIPQDFVHEILSESVPNAFAPFEMSESDFAWVFEPAIAPVKYEVLLHSIQWVRVSEVLTLPRARIRIRVQGAISGTVMAGGRIQPLSRHGDELVGEIPIAMLSGSASAVEVKAVTHSGPPILSKAHLNYRGHSNQVFFDPSCTRFNLNAVAKLHSWAYVGCHSLLVTGIHGSRSQVEALVYWDHAPASVEISGVNAPAFRPDTWLLDLRAETNEVRLKGEDQEMSFSSAIADRFYHLNLGAGVGPYVYSFNGGSQSVNTFTGDVNLYASYFIDEATRVVGFGATTFHATLNTDFGIYFETESFKTFDRRLSFQLLLGGHTIGFQDDSFYVQIGFPQGFEMVLTDAGLRGWNATAGAFIYPEISGKQYTNIWLRYGHPGVFYEINYIAWEETPTALTYRSKSLGLTVGFPLAHFF